MQAGVDACIEDGKYSFRTWYKWFPKGSVTFDDLEVKAGDEIEVWLVANSDNTSGTATVHNLSSKKSVTNKFSGEKALCKRNAQWIVEDFLSNGPVPFSDFGTVHFTDAHAIKDGKKVTTEGTYLMDIKQRNKRLTKSANSGTNVTIKYVG